jgi:septum formation inhibitor-activating ATPase MinD
MPGKVCVPQASGTTRSTFMTTSPSFTQEAADRLAAVEALYRFAAGIDLRDSALLSSSLAEEAVSDFRPAAAKAGFEYPVIEGRDVIVTALMTSLSALDTTHSVSNPRVTITGDTARMDVLVEAQHVPRSDPSRHYLMKNRYDVELKRSGDFWVITRNTVDNVWRSGDIGVLSGI